MYMNKKYYCSSCNYGHDNKTLFERHCETDKHKKMCESSENNTTIKYMNEHENLKEQNIQLKHQIDVLKAELDAYKECYKLLYKLGIAKEQTESKNNYHKCIEPINQMIKETNIDKVFEQVKNIEHFDELDDTGFPFSELYWSLMNNEREMEQIYLEFIKQYITLDDFKIDSRNHPNRFYFLKNDNECYTEVESNDMFEELIASINTCMINYGKHIHQLLINKFNLENKKFFKVGTLASKYVNFQSMRDKLIKEKHQQ